MSKINPALLENSFFTTYSYELDLPKNECPTLCTGLLCEEPARAQPALILQSWVPGPYPAADLPGLQRCLLGVPRLASLLGKLLQRLLRASADRPRSFRLPAAQWCGETPAPPPETEEEEPGRLCCARTAALRTRTTTGQPMHMCCQMRASLRRLSRPACLFTCPSTCDQQCSIIDSSDQQCSLSWSDRRQPSLRLRDRSSSPLSSSSHSYSDNAARSSALRAASPVLWSGEETHSRGLWLPQRRSPSLLPPLPNAPPGAKVLCRPSPPLCVDPLDWTDTHLLNCGLELSGLIPYKNAKYFHWYGKLSARRKKLGFTEQLPDEALGGKLALAAVPATVGLGKLSLLAVSNSLLVWQPFLALSRFHAWLQGSRPALVWNQLEARQNHALSTGGQRILVTPNAGGTSEWSEAISYELLRACYRASLHGTEMEIQYDQGSKITDYSVFFGAQHIGVSVTRVIDFADLPGSYKPAFREREVMRLLKKKLAGVVASTQGVYNAWRWEKQILHVFCTSLRVAQVVEQVYHNLVSELQADTLVVLTVAPTAWLY